MIKQLDKKLIKELLVDPGFVDSSDFKEAENTSVGSKEGIINFLLDKGLLKDEEWGQIFAHYYGYRFINLRNEKIDQELLTKVPELVARHHQAIVFGEKDDKILAALSDPGDLKIVHYLEKLFQKEFKVFYATKTDINQALSLYRQNLEEVLDKIVVSHKHGTNEGSLNSIAIELVNVILEYAYYNFASDIHIEPLEKKIKIRYRIDGVMHKVAEIPKEYIDLIMTRLKILSQLRIDEHQKAQDGKFRFKVGDEFVDIRVSILPVAGGENAVLRLLVGHQQQLNLSTIGLGESEHTMLSKTVKNPHGMVLVAGPTGSGKTTTLYEMIKEINSEAVHVATIEDPIEYNLEGVSQIQVNKKANLDFASGLRAIVRQDPDIIMVGEIRDEETVDIAINSAMTGHFVISTIHANNASTALTRLIDMGVEPYLLVSTLNLIISQRLVRKNCERCRYSYNLSPAEIDILKNNEQVMNYITEKKKKDLKDIMFFKSEGCKVCANSGYKGRVGLFEVMSLRENIKEMILQKRSSSKIQAVAHTENNMKLMVEDGLDKVFNGITTIEEVLRVAGANK